MTGYVIMTIQVFGGVPMPIQIKQGVNLLALLKQAGYSSYRLRHEKIFGEATLSKFRNGGLPSWGELSTICHLLKCQPAELIEFVEIGSDE